MTRIVAVAVITVQDNEQDAFEVFTDENATGTVGFVFDHADAYQLAAAPEMLEALRLALPFMLEEWDDSHAAVIAVRAAIAKAEGKGA